jgi:maltose O-acetyltransferase
MINEIKNEIYIWKDSINYFYLNYFLSKIPSRTLRTFLLRLVGSKIAKKVSIFANFEIRSPEKLIIDEGCSIGPRVLLDARSGLHIGKNVTIAAEAMIWTLHHNYDDINFAVMGDQVIIEEYVWICSRAIILPGVRIGKGAVVASGAVVTKDVAPFSIVGGIPAKLISKRKEQEYLYIPYFRQHII